jgi:hypothetical protein
MRAASEAHMTLCVSRLRYVALCRRYKITDHFHGTQAIIATRSFVPGPAGLWKRSKFIEIFGLHPSLPFGEDIFGGFTTLNSGMAYQRYGYITCNGR